MNGKKARTIRREAGFVPSEPRTYETLKIVTYLGRVKELPRTKVNTPDSPRGKYLEVKRNYK